MGSPSGTNLLNLAQVSAMVEASIRSKPGGRICLVLPRVQERAASMGLGILHRSLLGWLKTSAGAQQYSSAWQVAKVSQNTAMQTHMIDIHTQPCW